MLLNLFFHSNQIYYKLFTYFLPIFSQFKQLTLTCFAVLLSL